MNVKELLRKTADSVKKGPWGQYTLGTPDHPVCAMGHMFQVLGWKPGEMYLHPTTQKAKLLFWEFHRKGLEFTNDEEDQTAANMARLLREAAE